MLNLFIFIALAFAPILILGKYLEKIRIPAIFASLLVGVLLALHNPFESITSSQTFQTLADLGMYFLLFLVGIEINFQKFRHKARFIFQSIFIIILLEALFGTLLIHFVFNYEWVVAALVALSFATVGEAILIPILDEFHLINKPIGQAIIGIGTIDDIFEIFALVFAGLLVGTKVAEISSILSVIIPLIILLIPVTVLKLKLGKEHLRNMSTEAFFMLILLIFFLFVGFGDIGAAAPLGAIAAGMTVRTIMSYKRYKFVEKQVRTLAYGLFSPIFFISVGMELDLGYLAAAPLLVLLVIVVSNTAKILGSYIAGKKELGTKGSVLLGVGLSVRFSTSIVIIKFLYDNGIVDLTLYSVLIASSILFMFIVPLLFSRLLVAWDQIPANSQ